jgi:hypothetical protein
MNRIISFHEPRERYHGLRIVSSFFTLLGMAFLATGTFVLAYGLYLLVTAGKGDFAPEAGPLAIRQAGSLFLGADVRVIFSLLYSFCFLLGGLQQIAMGGLCRLFIHLEENTRATAQAVDRMRASLESSAEGAAPIFRS